MDINCLAYNTRLFTDTTVGWTSSQMYYDRLRIDYIADQVKNLRPKPDIVGFSGVWAKKTMDQLIYKLRDILPYSATDQNNSLWQMGSGLLLLSRFPLSNVSFEKYYHLVGNDSLSQKGFILATAENYWEKYLIACTHLQVGNDDNAIIARRANIFQLEYAISEAVKEARESTPVILLGDLSIIAENQSGAPTNDYEFLRDRLKTLQMSDAYRTLNPNAKSAPGYTYDAVNNKLIARFTPSDATNKVRSRLDYLFVRGLTPKTVTIPNEFTFRSPDGTGTYDLSDRYPLDGEFSYTYN